MSFDWNSFVVLADELRTLQCRGGVEARLRSSASRGYYGLFHVVRLFLREEGMKFGNLAQVHQEVVQALRTSADNERRVLGVELGRLRSFRNSADYDDHIDNVAQLDGDSLKLRTSIQRRLAALRRPGTN